MTEKEIQELLQVIEVMFSNYEMNLLLLYLLRDIFNDDTNQIINVLKDWKEIIVYSI